MSSKRGVCGRPEDPRCPRNTTLSSSAFTSFRITFVVLVCPTSSSSFFSPASYALTHTFTRYKEGRRCGSTSNGCDLLQYKALSAGQARGVPRGEGRGISRRHDV